MESGIKESLTDGTGHTAGSLREMGEWKFWFKPFLNHFCFCPVLIARSISVYRIIPRVSFLSRNSYVHRLSIKNREPAEFKKHHVRNSPFPRYVLSYQVRRQLVRTSPKWLVLKLAGALPSHKLSRTTSTMPSWPASGMERISRTSAWVCQD